MTAKHEIRIKPKPGRPRQYHEKRVQVRIPLRLVDEFKEWLLERTQAPTRGPSKQELQGVVKSKADTIIENVLKHNAFFFHD
jgi:hypothetical protein